MDYLRIRLHVYLIFFFAVMILGTIGFMISENLSPADAFYFCIVTVATVGYGDIHPATDTGKFLAIVLIITGVGTFLGVIANATEIMLSKRERIARMDKLKMVIGTFFSEVGTHLLTSFSDYDPDLWQIRQDLIITGEWTDEDFRQVNTKLQKYDYSIDVTKADLPHLADFLSAKRDFLLRLLENPSLLEHESFTELLHAVFHLAEELDARTDLHTLPNTDKVHLGHDIARAYCLLVDQWLDYMEYLKDNYPYLFSLAMRTNPFDRQASPIVQ